MPSTYPPVGPPVNVFSDEGGKLVYRYDSETLIIQPWDENSLRITATHSIETPSNDWALSDIPSKRLDVGVSIHDTQASIKNGNIEATVSARGKITIRNQKGKPLLQEYARHRLDLTDPKCSALKIQAREFKPILGGDYHLTARFESVNPQERIYGMGQYQQQYLNLKGADLELAQRNSQASVPFAVSSLGYGFLWNNPAIGRAVFGTNLTTFEAFSTRTLDYWVTAGDTPSEIVRMYTQVTGRVPMMPEYGLGFWQCKLRYQTQEELLTVAREYKRRNLPLDLIVVDYFHWPRQGEWKFDPTFWPDPDAMVAELKALNIELMVSIWPTVDHESENFQEMLRLGLLVRQDRGIRISMEGQGNPIHFDPTNPAARSYIWSKVQQNYYSKGIRVFWLDEAEPEYSVYDFDIYRYHAGPNLAVGNIYPREYARSFYEGMLAAGQHDIVNLVRCAWAGSQRYGALIWSGDIASSWDSLRDQFCAGLNVSLAGMAWFTTDIGGFHGGDPNDPAFRELFVRWFQWATFCPVMRLHGDREPKQPRLGDSGGSFCRSGAPNEVWSYGEEVYEICVRYMRIREEMRDYIRGIMRQAHEQGDPVMRPCFYDFPYDEAAWLVEDQYMFGPRYLCAPVFSAGQREREVYLPTGAKWKLVFGSDTQAEVAEGGKKTQVKCAIGTMPVFERV